MGFSVMWDVLWRYLITGDLMILNLEIRRWFQDCNTSGLREYLWVKEKGWARTNRIPAEQNGSLSALWQDLLWHRKMSCFWDYLQVFSRILFGTNVQKVVTTSCPCYSLSSAVKYKNDLGSSSGCRDFCTAIWCKLITLEKEIKGNWQMKVAMLTQATVDGIREGKYILFAEEWNISSLCTTGVISMLYLSW